MSDELQLLREFRADVPEMEADAVRGAYERATRSNGTFVRRLLHKPVTQPRYAAAFIAVTAAAAAAIALPIALGNSGGSHHSSLRLSAPPRPPAAGKLFPTASVAVANTDEADAQLPFKAVLPSDATPTEMQVSSPDQTAASSAWLVAHFDTDATGSYQLSEYSTDATVGTLQQWAETSDGNCSDCTTQHVVTEDGVHVLVLASPVIGLRVYWVRGDGTSPVLTEIDWSTDMPANNVVPSPNAALAIAGDIISQGG